MNTAGEAAVASAERAIAASTDPLVAARRLNIWAQGRNRGERRAIVVDLSLGLQAGRTVGLVGESGSGKSMTAKAIAGLLPMGIYAEGQLSYGGKDLLGLTERAWRRIRGRHISLVMQDPFTSLNPVRKCGAHVMEGLRLVDTHTRDRAAVRADAAQRLEEVGISESRVLDRYPFELSGGMRQRVALASALATDPHVLIADEPTTALDATTQRRVLDLLVRIQRDRGITLLLISHDLRVVFSTCDDVYVLYAGQLLEHGPTRDVEAEPLHPYTLGLLLSEPLLERRTVIASIPGRVASAQQMLDTCPFVSRCPWAADVCTTGRPPLREVAPGRYSACVRLQDIREEMHLRRRAATEQTDSEIGSAACEPIVQVKSLGKSFVQHAGPRGGSRVVAVSRVTLDIRDGESLGIVGESGSGKTTLARCIAGLQAPSEGTVSIGAVVVNGPGGTARAARTLLHGTVQMVFQDPYSSLNPMRTVGSTLAEALHAGRGSGSVSEIAGLLSQVGLSSDHVRRRPAALSGGERQRVAIARALAMRPRLLICDESVSALDVSIQAQILELLQELRTQQGLSLLFISHDLAVVRQITDRIAVMYRGVVVEVGETEQILDSPRHAYTRLLLDSARAMSVGNQASSSSV